MKSVKGYQSQTPTESTPTAHQKPEAREGQEMRQPAGRMTVFFSMEALAYWIA